MMKLEDVMVSDNKNGITLETVDAQYCSDWLKSEIKRMLSELTRLQERVAQYESEELHESLACSVENEGLHEVVEALEQRCEKLKRVVEAARKYMVAFRNHDHRFFPEVRDEIFDALDALTQGTKEGKG